MWGCTVCLKGTGVRLDIHLKSSHRSRLQIRLDVSWIQVGNTHKKAWSRESPEFTKAKTRILYERRRHQTNYHLQINYWSNLSVILLHIKQQYELHKIERLRMLDTACVQVQLPCYPLLVNKLPLLCPNRSPFFTCSFHQSASQSKTYQYPYAQSLPKWDTVKKKEHEIHTSRSKNIH